MPPTSDLSASSSDSTIVIAGGRLIDPQSKTDRSGDLVLSRGRIVQFGGKYRPSRGDQIIDARDRIVTPGLIDPHVHLREPGKEEAETIATGSAAAVNGGFTTVCCMPNTTPALDHPAMIDSVFRRAELAGMARVFPVAAVTKGRKGEELAEIGLMAKAGAVGFSDDGECVDCPAVQRRAFVFIRQAGSVMMQHCQDRSLTQGSVMNAGPVALRMGLTGWPAVAEEMVIERDIRLNRDIGCRYHVQHMSCAGSVDIVRRARAEGHPVSAEVSPHHLLLTDESCLGYNTNAKMNPPLRTRPDVESLLEGVQDGTITVLATDHAPHTREAKELEFDAAPFGIVGIETALPLYLRALIEPKVIGWMRLVELMTTEPARLCGLDAEPWNLGSLREGGPADVTIIDPAVRWTIKAGNFVSKSRNTPFDGWSVTGRAEVVVVGGTVKLNRKSPA